MSETTRRLEGIDLQLAGGMPAPRLTVAEYAALGALRKHEQAEVIGIGMAARKVTGG